MSHFITIHSLPQTFSSSSSTHQPEAHQISFPNFADWDDSTWQKKKHEIRALYQNCVLEGQQEEKRKLSIQTLQDLIVTLRNRIFEQKLVRKPDNFIKTNEQIVEKMVKALSLAGKEDAYAWYFYHTGHIQSKITTVVERTLTDFQEGNPCSFAHIAYLLAHRKIGPVSFESYELFKDVTKSIDILQKLAFIGVKTAGYYLSRIYYYDDIGVDKSEIKLNLPIEKRLEGLKKLAELEIESAQFNLGAIFSNNVINHQLLKLSKKERLAHFDNAFKNEKKYQFYLTDIFVTNKIGELDYTFTKEKRFSALNERAHRGDDKALRALVRYYFDGFMGEGKHLIRTNITLKERLESIEKLKPLDPDLINSTLTQIYTGHTPFDTFISKQVADQWLISEGLNGTNSCASKALAEAYDKVIHPSSKCTFRFSCRKEEALAGLRKLTKLGCKKALELLLDCNIPVNEKLMYEEELAFMGNESVQRNLVNRIKVSQPDIEKPLEFLFKLTNFVQFIKF